MREVKNDLILRVLNGEMVERPPIWMMRQAGRFLPDFRALREKYSFFERVETPELAAKITVMPVHQVGVDAAILFSDILVIPKALGMDVQLVKGKGPILSEAIRDQKAFDGLSADGIEDRLHHVMQAITATLEMLDGEVPLLGFAGAPWTVFCYMVEGSGSKNFDIAKSLIYQKPTLAKQLLQLITDCTIDYVKNKAKYGVSAIQVFDSWGGMLGREDYLNWSLPYIKQIIEAIDEVPTIIYAKGTWHVITDLAALKPTAMSIDWTMDPRWAREKVGPDIVLQGNLDPSALLSTRDDIARRTINMLNAFTPQKHIANLGHGILPTVPVENAQTFIDTVKAYRYA